MKVIISAIIVLFSLFVLLLLSSLIARIWLLPHVESDIESGIKHQISNEVIQVEILNATKIRGLAATTMKYLRERNFDVVKTGNNEESEKKSFIIDRLGDYNSSKKVAFALGIKDSMIVQQVDSSLFLRCSIIIGEDYKTLKPFK